MRVAWWAYLVSLSVSNVATALSVIVVMVRLPETHRVSLTLNGT